MAKQPKGPVSPLWLAVKEELARLVGGKRKVSRRQNKLFLHPERPDAYHFVIDGDKLRIEQHKARWVSYAHAIWEYPLERALSGEDSAELKAILLGLGLPVDAPCVNHIEESG